MIIMKRIVFSPCVVSNLHRVSSVVRTPYQGRYFYIRAWTALGSENRKLRVASCPVRSATPPTSRTGWRESTRDLQIFRVAYHPENTFWRAGCPAFTI